MPADREGTYKGCARVGGRPNPPTIIAKGTVTKGSWLSFKPQQSNKGSAGEGMREASTANGKEQWEAFCLEGLKKSGQSKTRIKIP